MFALIQICTYLGTYLKFQDSFRYLLIISSFYYTTYHTQVGYSIRYLYCVGLDVIVGRFLHMTSTPLPINILTDFDEWGLNIQLGGGVGKQNNIYLGTQNFIVSSLNYFMEDYYRDFKLSGFLFTFLLKTCQFEEMCCAISGKSQYVCEILRNPLPHSHNSLYSYRQIYSEGNQNVASFTN